MTDSQQCYGRMFPPVLPVETNRDVRGRVFRYRVEAPGMAVTSRAVEFDGPAWEECLRCAEFDSCYRLSAGRLLLERALR